MPKIGDVHPDDSDFIFVSIKNSHLIYRDKTGKLMTADEVNWQLKDKSIVEEDAEEEE